ncbi:hypothetical protein EDL99_01650 [Ornithobacterium rhinotracheale]|uniref:DUF4350 domain-containing protein n=1 Tax=Ornithobacterium rhinotracheale TaxID=28251 RepID=UPI00129C6703|nr:hypothetical protein [Ornithobacterium rhinotracheale]MRJ07592.1 hypothetical protein [Ornithobacterium rhinotracheale]UOH78191.1 hypothetical protein MT996_01660 [Ornithobacterium rhinotracheale]
MNNKLFRTYGIILGLVVLVMMFFEFTKTPVSNWSKSYNEDSKDPFGLYIFDQEADSLFHGKLTRTSESPFEYEPADSTQTRNYLIIGKQISEEAKDKLLSEVEKGCNLFLASDNYYGKSMMSRILINSFYMEKIDTLNLNFINKRISPISLSHLNDVLLITHAKPNSLNVLGTIKSDSENKFSSFFIEIPLGKGKIYFLSTPEIFTNYGILNGENYKAIPKILGYLPNQETIWFQNRSNKEWKYQNSILRVIFENPPLRWAWRLFLLGLIIFMIFTAKRKQRIIPIIPPVKNESAEFVKNISNLYLQEGDAKDMAQKKALYFLQKVRSELMIPTDELDQKFIERLHIKTMQPHETVQEAVRLLTKAIHPKAPVHEDELIKMNKILDQIYKS